MSRLLWIYGWVNQILTLGDAKLILVKRGHGSVLSPVVVSPISDQVIPPRSQCFVYAEATDYGLCDQDILFSAFVDKMAHLNFLLGGSVATGDSQSRIQVAATNNSNRPSKLFTGTRIGVIS